MLVKRNDPPQSFKPYTITITIEAADDEIALQNIAENLIATYSGKGCNVARHSHFAYDLKSAVKSVY
jgi:hypothetical protein